MSELMALICGWHGYSFQRLAVSSVWIEFHVALRERVELTVKTVWCFSQNKLTWTMMIGHDDVGEMREESSAETSSLVMLRHQN